MVKVMSTPIILTFCIVGIILILLNARIDSFDPILVLLIGAAFEALRREERKQEREEMMKSGE